MNMKKLAKAGAIVVVLSAAYIGTIEYWVWKWESPHMTLPKDHLTNNISVERDIDQDMWSDAAQQLMLSLADELQSVSMSGAMTVDGKLSWAGAVGLASVDPYIAASPDTQYRIGSVSKAITAVALMRMVEEDMVDIDAPIHQYLPDYPKYQTEMTMRQLASHTAGVRHYSFDILKFPPTDSFSNVLYKDVNDALSQFEDDALLFSPGQGFNYSTHGYTLLSAVMQAAAGKPFATLVEEFVTQPLDMAQTKPEHLLQNAGHLAEFYSSDDGLYGITPEQNLSNKVAGGGYVSTPSDLVKLGSALLRNEVLSPETFEEMVSVQPMHDGSENPQGYALGWRHYETSLIIDENNKVDVIHHGGRSQGADSFLLLVPDHNISVAITTNGQGEKSRVEIQKLAYRLAGMVIKKRATS